MVLVQWACSQALYVWACSVLSHARIHLLLTTAL